MLALVSGASAAPVFVIVGHGWGHGIGMSQYGAYGYALHGWDHERILAHYFTGTKAGQTSNGSIRVLLDAGRSSVTLSSPTRWQVASGTRTWTMGAGSRTLEKAFTVMAAGKQRTLTSPATFTPLDGGRLSIDGRPYRGKVVLRKVSGKLWIVNSVRLESYLRGVVPYEMPSSWAAEALRAQAVAARSYALVAKQGRSGYTYDVVDDTRSQVYGGIPAETAATNAAVAATAGEVRMYGSSVAQTFFYSSSGGWTAANEDVWGGSPVPYLRSVRDRYDALGGKNPRHNWSLPPYSRDALDAKLGSYVLGALRDLRPELNPSRRVDDVTTIGSRGTSSVSGGTLRTLLALNSTWFRIGVLKVSSVKTTVAKGKGTYLTGLARGAGRTWLERRRGTGPWQTARELTLAGDGTFKTLVRPTMTTTFRIRTQSIYGVHLPAPARSTGRTIRVAAKPVLYRPSDRSGLVGFVDTREPGAEVAIQQRAGGKWRTVARGTTDRAGVFRISFGLGNGTYRAVLVRGGRTAGSTAPLTVVGS